MSAKLLCIPFLLFPVLLTAGSGAQTVPAPSPPAQGNPGGPTISLDEAIQMALQHNHSLLAARTVIQQNQAEEIDRQSAPEPGASG